MMLTVDRLEGSFAVCECEDGMTLRVPLEELPAEIREGSVLYKEDGKFRLCPSEEIVRRSRIEDKLAAILKKN